MCYSFLSRKSIETRVKSLFRHDILRRMMIEDIERSQQLIHRQLIVNEIPDRSSSG
jgi:hypothetical protein